MSSSTLGVDPVRLKRDDRRRTPGSCREEGSMPIGVSIDYNIRLEQGRERRPSDQVLGASAGAPRQPGIKRAADL
ncbi:hypothetical protein Psi02_07130 [Planotetraspora silvatica]|uniref:Uncharacterized protein n=1 Tax=Planotetraspora silvatica TaxID=234614 RepID=A0A8J3UEV8_9ACTN|nr:hypothetical protein [Planotetraspora silvatica]GII44289.1 hypothetical protein Psi02_07130 [Planotetraspora silvatica]